MKSAMHRFPDQIENWNNKLLSYKIRYSRYKINIKIN